jgi:outer membrane lipase/esterase
MTIRAVWLAGAASIVSFCLAGGVAEAQQFSNTIFFGDSDTDSGQFLFKESQQGKPNSKAPPGTGAFTTNPDPIWSVILGQRFGITVTPSDAPGGGNNFATGGARVAIDDPGFNEPSATDQVNAYLASTGGRADPNALYTVYIGTNDLKTNSAPNIIVPENVPAIEALAQQTANLVKTLAGAGARYFIVPNAYVNFGAIIQTQQGTSQATINTEVASHSLYNQTMWNDIAAAGINFIPADVDDLLAYVANHPGTFGLTNVDILTPACTPPTNAFQCGPANLVAPNADQTHLFADAPSAPDGGGHLSGAGQLIEADYIYSLVVAPSEISYLAEAPVKTRTSLVDTIFQQIAISDRQRNVGSSNAWFSGDISSLSFGNFPGFPTDPGTPVMVSAGEDYLWTPNWLVGGAVSVGTTKQSLSLGGNFKQNEFAISGYSAFTAGPFWFNAIGTYGGLAYSVDRVVPIGIATASNTSQTLGSNSSLALETGYNYTLAAPDAAASAPMPVKASPAASQPRLTYGPVAGILLQRIYVDGFTENDNLGGVTALSFADQIRNSAVTELGYQAQIALGSWAPYAKLTWNHELVPFDRSVTASLTSVTAPSFSMPAVVLGKDWGTGTIGTTVALGRGMTGYASFTGQFGEGSATFYGGQIGLNIALNAPGAPVATK